MERIVYSGNNRTQWRRIMQGDTIYCLEANSPISEYTEENKINKIKHAKLMDKFTKLLWKKYEYENVREVYDIIAIAKGCDIHTLEDALKIHSKWNIVRAVNYIKSIV